MLYSEPLFRPPAEAYSLIVQVTEGCAYNRCIFCPMYKGASFASMFSRKSLPFPKIGRIIKEEKDEREMDSITDRYCRV